MAKTAQGSGACVTRRERPAVFGIEERVNLSAAQELAGIMEPRIGPEVESVSLASRRRTEEQLTIMREQAPGAQEELSYLFRSGLGYLAHTMLLGRDRQDKPARLIRLRANIHRLSSASKTFFH